MRLAIMATLFAFATAATASDEALHAELALLATKRIYFAHQSVGANILQGVAELTRGAGVTLRIVDAPCSAAFPAGSLRHFYFLENAAPLGNLAIFDAEHGADSRIDNV